ncbi:MAG: GNAT family N-acetyltransferase [Rubrobacteraceae bacterium]
MPANVAGGYAHPGYAASLAGFGAPRLLPRSGGHVLERRIPGTPHQDAMGPYPLFACRDWPGLQEDLEEIPGLVTLTVVTDPFGEYDERLLDNCFEVVRPFKEHFVADLTLPVNEIVSKHHRYYARKALEKVRVEECAEPARFLDEWTELYAGLVRRHGLTGIKAFSRDAFARQLRVPGVVALRAVSGEETVGMHLWYVSGEVAYSHLAASSPKGYGLMAAYALYRLAVERFAGRVRWLDLGAGAGAGKETGGLDRFKKGWSTGTRTAYLCGRVFDRETYAELSGAKAAGPGYFPAYRTDELT